MTAHDSTNFIVNQLYEKNSSIPIDSKEHYSIGKGGSDGDERAGHLVLLFISVLRKGKENRKKTRESGESREEKSETAFAAFASLFRLCEGNRAVWVLFIQVAE